MTTNSPSEAIPTTVGGAKISPSKDVCSPATPDATGTSTCSQRPPEFAMTDATTKRDTIVASPGATTNKGVPVVSEEKVVATPLPTAKKSVPVVSAEKSVTAEDVGQGKTAVDQSTQFLTHVLFGVSKIRIESSPDAASDGKSTISFDESNNFVPAPIPDNPINEDCKRTPPLVQELAWLVEESRFILPSNETAHGPQIPLALGLAWRNASVQLRKLIVANFPLEVRSMLNAKKKDAPDSSAVDAYQLLLQENAASYNSDVFCSLRKEARDALVLGYRRSASIGIWLDLAHGNRFGKQPTSSDDKQRKGKVPRHRLKNGDIVVSSSIPEPSTKTSTDASMPHSLDTNVMDEMQTIASKVPSELTKLEEEVAWLVEESLIFQPKASEDAPLSAPSDKQATVVVSSGPVTQPEINFDYVLHHASDPVKKLLAKARRRPLQRLVRFHNKEVNVSFSKRRDEIFSLLLGGYRRVLTHEALPSHEYLVHTGRAEIMVLRRMRYKRYSGGVPIQEAAQAKDILSACNATFGSPGLNDITNSPRKKRKYKKKQHAATPSRRNKKLKLAFI